MEVQYLDVEVEYPEVNGYPEVKVEVEEWRRQSGSVDDVEFREVATRR